MKNVRGTCTCSPVNALDISRRDIRIRIKVFSHSIIDYNYAIPARNILRTTYHTFKTLNALRKYIDNHACMFEETDVTFPAKIIETHYISKDNLRMSISDYKPILTNTHFSHVPKSYIMHNDAIF